MKNLHDDYQNAIKYPQQNDYRNIIYDNISNVNSYGLDSKYGSQIALLTFLDDKGNIIDANGIYNLILREPFKVSLSTKTPVDSPYVSLVNDIQKDAKKMATMALIYDNVDEDLYTPIALSDDYTYKTYAGTTNPTFNLNCRIYMDKTIFKPITNENNYIYSMNFLKDLLGCILPKSRTKGGEVEETLKILAEKYAYNIAYNAASDIEFRKINLPTLAVGTKIATEMISKGITEAKETLNNISEGTYGANLVSFCIPWLFGNLKTFGSTNNEKFKGMVDGKYIEIDYGRMFETKCFVKNVNLKLSKEYYVERIIAPKYGVDTKRYPSYIDIDITLESVNIPSTKSWLKNWIL